MSIDTHRPPSEENADFLAINYKLLVALGAALLVLFPAVSHFPWVAKDSGVFFPRMLDTLQFMRHEGLSIQWWTPTFGGGLPVYGNPQSFQFSLPQWLLFYVPPLQASLLSTFIVAFAGVFALLAVGEKTLELSPWVNAVFGLAVGCSGFELMHTAVGHLTYHAFPLVYVALWAFTHRDLSRRNAILIGSLLFAYAIYSGGYFVSLVMPLTLLAALFLLGALGKLEGKRTLMVGLGSLALGGALSLSKLNAVYEFMRNFPRMVESVPMPHLWAGPLQLFLLPAWLFLHACGFTSLSLSQFIQKQYGMSFGVWEFDQSLFIGSILCAPIGLWLVGSRRSSYPRIKWASLVGLVAVLLFTWNLASARGALFEILKRLPLLGSLRLNPRFMSVWILPVGMLGALGMQRSVSKIAIAKGLMGGLFSLQLGIVFSFFVSHPERFDLIFPVAGTESVYRLILQDDPNLARIHCVALASDFSALAQGCSSFVPEEPAVGFRRPPLIPNPHLKIGSTDTLDQGFYNLNYVPSLVGPAADLRDGIPRISSGDRENFDLFVSHRSPHWPLSRFQVLLNRFSVLALMSWWVLLLWPVSLLAWRKGMGSKWQLQTQE